MPREYPQYRNKRKPKKITKEQQEKLDNYRNQYLKNRYGISSKDFERMLCEQEYSCEICHIHITDMKKGIVVDHNHETGDVRGLLCNSCNVALGHFKDNTFNLQSAIKYLQKHDNQE